MNVWNKASTFEEEKHKYIKPSLELIKFYNSIKSRDIRSLVIEHNISSIKEFTEIIISMIELQKISDAEILCCNASTIFHNEPMIFYFRAVLARMANDLQKSLRFIYTALKLSGSSTIYYEYSRILSAIGEHEKSRLAQKHADYKKYVEDTTCAPIVTA